MNSFARSVFAFLVIGIVGHCYLLTESRHLFPGENRWEPQESPEAWELTPLNHIVAFPELEEIDTEVARAYPRVKNLDVSQDRHFVHKRVLHYSDEFNYPKQEAAGDEGLKVDLDR